MPTGLTNCSGSCRDLDSDRANCGMCGRTCAAGQVCSAGACVLSCAVGLTNCSSSCRDLDTDRANCGMCGRACASGEVCVGGSCTLSCPTGQSSCGGTCANFTNDRNNCGACGRACAAGQVCSASACVVSCVTGQTNCSGTCRDLTSDRANCGACGRACASGQVCTAGVCVTSCPTGQESCGGFCVFTASDPNNCGGCGVVCPTRVNASRVCADSTCSYVCATGRADCDFAAGNGCEVTPATDVLNCGRCGNACPARANATATCASGTCGFTCNAGFADCDGVATNGCEVNLNTSSTNCGRCGNACGGSVVCMSGTCGPRCNSGTRRALFYGSAGTLEQPYLPTGTVVTVASDAMWRSMTAADFATYQILIVGDLSCSGPTSANLQALFDTRATWGAAVNGRVAVTTADAGCHQPGATGAVTYLRTVLSWVASGPGLGAYFSGDWGRRRFDYLSPFGAFSSTSLDRDDVTITMASHGTMAGSTSGSLSNWGSTYHAFMSSIGTGFVTTATNGSSQSIFAARDVVCSP
ncbi:MAG: hypothetical protein U0326_27690 [Polyangiales bacterium]